MSERPPDDEEHLGRFRSPRDEALYTMAANAWANESGGSTDSPTGAYYRVSNSEPELAEILQAFSERFETIGLPDPRQLLGHFIVVELREGFVDVREFPDEDAAVADFRKQERIHQFWQDLIAGSAGRQEDA